MKMKITVRRVLVGVSVLVLAFAIYGVYMIALFLNPTNERDNADPSKQSEMIALTRKGGQLAVFPTSSDHFSIQTEGNSFTRTFRGSFSDSPEAIARWLLDSKGIAEGSSEVQPDKSTKYLLKTAEGASYGEVIVSPDGSQVSFRVSWS